MSSMSTPLEMFSFEVCSAAYLDDSNTLGHLTGYILTSQPLTKGGLSPYDVVPTCFLQSADHLFHDEVCNIALQDSM